MSDALAEEHRRDRELGDLLIRSPTPAETVVGLREVETPVRIEYALTDKGRDLEQIVRAIHRWADRWIPVAARSAR
ncbi:MAG TPA: winged helix-turn-helix transcriptional regulator [bacterium]|nr:winged helix-turn-helix transcriptional regulator [bacterium]